MVLLDGNPLSKYLARISANQAVEADAFIFDNRQCGDRSMTTQSELGDECPLDINAGANLGILDLRQDADRPGIFGAAFQTERALAWSRKRFVRLKHLRGPGFETKSSKSGICENNGLDAGAADLPDAGLDIPPYITERKVRAKDAQLDAPSVAAGGDNASRSDRSEIRIPAGYQGVARVLSNRRRAERESFRQS